MHIIVCICDGIYGNKPVFLDKPHQIYEKNLYRIINKNDLYAIETAVRIKKKYKDVHITTISVGPNRSSDLLMKTLLIGADRAIWGNNENIEYCNKYDVGYVIYKIIKEHVGSFDLLIVGNASEDFSFGLIGPELASKFKLIICNNIDSIDDINHQIRNNNYKLKLSKKMEKGDRLIFEIQTPMVIAVDGKGKGMRGIDIQDIINNCRKKVEIINIQQSLSSINDREERKYGNVEFNGYHEPRPRPKKIYIPDSSLSAIDRLRCIMQGNVMKKTSNIVEGNMNNVASEFIKYLKINKIV